MWLELTAGLALFLYGVTLLSDSLKAIAGERMRTVLARCTRNRFFGVITGTVATTVLDSSSVTIIMLIALVNAGVLSFQNSLGVILGSNIGTTVSSQIFAFDIDRYAPLALAAGLLIHLLAKSDAQREIGRIVLGVGMIFFGLYVIGEAVAPLKKSDQLLAWVKQMEHPLKGAIIGAVFTIIIQSSSAMLGIIITLASQGMVSLPAGVALMIGAEVGTCADTLIATLGRSRAAFRAGLFHLLFNMASACMGIVFASQLAQLAVWTAGNSVPRQIANAHVLFNGLGVAVFVWVIPQSVRFLEWLIPPAGSEMPAERAKGREAVEHT